MQCICFEFVYITEIPVVHPYDSSFLYVQIFDTFDNDSRHSVVRATIIFFQLSGNDNNLTYNLNEPILSLW